MRLAGALTPSSGRGWQVGGGIKVCGWRSELRTAKYALWRGLAQVCVMAQRGL